MKSVLLFVLFIFGPFGVHAQSGQEVRPVKRPRPESPASVPPTGTATRAVYKDPTWARPPKLVVGIVVDQMRVDYLYRYWDNFGPGGFKRLVGEGAFLRNVQYDYAPTHTAPGHASIYTGSTPMHHGIVANDMWIRSTGTPLYCVQDDAASGVGGEGSKGQRSPNNLLATTISDELERRTDGRSKTIGVAMKDRSSILPIGRTGDAAYWFFEGTEGHMATSTWYMTELPQWVKDFNARGLPQQYLKQSWDLLLPKDRYHQALPDDNPYEEPLAGTLRPTLPMDVKAMYETAGRSTVPLRFIPAGNTFTTEFALAAIAGEELGQDAVTDLLAISYGATDELGHEVGPRAVELEDMYIRLDLELARLFDALDSRVGKGAYTVMLTADHAAVDVPAFLRDQQGSAGYVDVNDLIGRVNAALSARFGEGEWVVKRIKEQLWMSEELIKRYGADPAEVQHVAADALLSHPMISDAITASDLARNAYGEGLRRSVQRGFMPMRSGDVCYVMRPSHLVGYAGMSERGTEHGSPWRYDTHVPVLFMGAGIGHTEVVRTVSITDLAPTLAMIMGCALPDATLGSPVPEVLR